MVNVNNYYFMMFVAQWVNTLRKYLSNIGWFGEQPDVN